MGVATDAQWHAGYLARAKCPGRFGGQRSGASLEKFVEFACRIWDGVCISCFAVVAGSVDQSDHVEEFVRFIHVDHCAEVETSSDAVRIAADHLFEVA